MAEVEGQFQPAEVVEPKGLLRSLFPLALGALGPGGLVAGAVMAKDNVQQRRRDQVTEAFTEAANRGQVGAAEAAQNPSVLIEAGNQLLGDPRTAARGQEMIRQAQQITNNTRLQNQELRAQANNDRTFMREARQGLVDDIFRASAPLRADAQQLSSVLNAPQQVAGDQQTIYSYIRLITGGGGQSISDRDVQRLSGSPAIDNQLRQIFDRYLSGRALTAVDRNDIQEAAVNAYQQSRRFAGSEIDLFRNTAERLGIPENELFNEQVFLTDEALAKLRAPQIALAAAERRADRGEPEPVRAPAGEGVTMTLEELRAGGPSGG